MKRLFLTLCLSIPLNALSESTLPIFGSLNKYIDITGGVAAIGTDGIPTAVIFNAITGNFVKKINFLDKRDCAYQLLDLSANATTITLTVKASHPQLGTYQVSTPGVCTALTSYGMCMMTPPPIITTVTLPDNYPNCTYAIGKSAIIRETRKLTNGALIKQISLQDYTNIVIP